MKNSRHPNWVTLDIKLGSKRLVMPLIWYPYSETI